MKRREIIQRMMMGATLASIPSIGFGINEDRTINFDNNTILFQGDSITDAGRNRENNNPNSSSALGGGYVSQIVGSLLKSYPSKGYKCFNKGISGNKVFQLRDRWQTDCLDIKPDVLSILIGVNDYWHFRNGKYDGTVEVYDKDLRSLLEYTLEKLPDVKIIICEPFIVKGGTAVSEEWNEPFGKFQVAARTISKDFNLTFVPFQMWFDDALKEAPASYWCPDGVHPSIAGASLMAEAWLHSFKFL